MQKQNRTSLYIADRDAGMTYRAIATKYGVSYQAVAQVCARNGKGAVARFRPYTAEEVIYPNLRQWLNENKVSRSEFARRLGNLPWANELENISKWFRGVHNPSKRIIDNMLAVTGLTYEQLFATEREEG